MRLSRQEVLNNKILPEVAEMKVRCQSLMIASADINAIPNVSYANFAMYGDQFAVLVSDSVQRCHNICENPHTSIMLIEDEQGCREIFARRRVVYQATAQRIEKASELGQTLLKLLEERYGSIITGLSSQEDFTPYLFTVHQGRFVKGFGKAFNLTGENLDQVTHLTVDHNKSAH